MNRLKVDLFDHALSVLDFSDWDSENVRKEHINDLQTLGHDFFFKMNDFITLLARVEKHFKELQQDMIKTANIKAQELRKGRTNEYILRNLNGQHRNEILNIIDSIDSQLDALGLGIVLRVHSYLEEVLKRLCLSVKNLFDLDKTYKDMRREGKFSGDRISTLEQCIIYIHKSPLHTNVDIYGYDIIFEWNKVRNLLFHDGGEISKEKANKLQEKLGLKTFEGQSLKVVYNPDGSLEERSIIKKPLKIKLSIPEIVWYIFEIDRFLAKLVNPNAIKSYKQSQEIKNIALNEFGDEKRFKELFYESLEKIKNNKNIAREMGVSKIDDAYEEHLMESLKMLLRNFR